MTEHQQPLAPLVAALSAAMRATAHDKVASRVPVEVLHALILFALARIVDRLEMMVRHWQQGLLPGLPPAPSARPTPHRPHAIRPRRTTPEIRRRPTAPAFQAQGHIAQTRPAKLRRHPAPSVRFLAPSAARPSLRASGPRDRPTAWLETHPRPVVSARPFCCYIV